MGLGGMLSRPHRLWRRRTSPACMAGALLMVLVGSIVKPSPNFTGTYPRGPHPGSAFRWSERRLDGVWTQLRADLHKAEDNFDPWTVLQISPTTPEAEAKKKYKRMIAKYHPDRDPSPEAAEKFSKIVRAYAVISGEDRQLDEATLLKNAIENLRGDWNSRKKELEELETQVAAAEEEVQKAWDGIDAVDTQRVSRTKEAAFLGISAVAVGFTGQLGLAMGIIIAGGFMLLKVQSAKAAQKAQAALQDVQVADPSQQAQQEDGSADLKRQATKDLGPVAAAVIGMAVGGPQGALVGASVGLAVQATELQSNIDGMRGEIDSKQRAVDELKAQAVEATEETEKVQEQMTKTETQRNELTQELGALGGAAIGLGLAGPVGAMLGGVVGIMFKDKEDATGQVVRGTGTVVKGLWKAVGKQAEKAEKI